MKHQYFGDIRDLFKYDLIESILSGISTISCCVFIPMLTENDGRNDGNKTNHKSARAGFHNQKLKTFLYKCVREGRRNIYELEKYYKEHEIDVIFAVRDLYLHKYDREKYFRSAIDDLRPRALVFLDPDTGLEVKKSSARHLLLSEVSSIFAVMDNDSLMMVYQHFGRKNSHLEQEADRAKQLLNIVNVPVVSVSDKEIIFFCIAKGPYIHRQVIRILRNYANTYPEIRFRRY